MKLFIKFLVLGMILLVPLRVSAGHLEDYTEALKIRLSAAACLASYSSPNGSLVTLKQKVYKVKDGELLSEGTYSRNTLNLTPMEALIFEARAMDKESSAWMDIK